MLVKWGGGGTVYTACQILNTYDSDREGYRMARFDPKTVLSRQLLEQLYVEDGFSIKELANRFGCGETTVRRALRAQGIAIRNKHDYRLEISRAELERLYCEEGVTEDAIGQAFGCNGRTIGRRLEEYGIPRRQSGPVARYCVSPALLTSWTPELAYAVGLLAADGCLAKDRAEVEFVSSETELIKLFCRALQLNDVRSTVAQRRSGGAPWYRIRLNDGGLRRFLEETGLTPAKSRTLGELQLPDEVFRDFLRGALDGDGSWYISQHWNGRYRYLRVELCSASLCFVEWIRGKIEQLADLRGNLHENRRGHAYNLLYIGRKALALGDWIYYASDLLALPRKRLIWQEMHSQQGELDG
jgi:AraC-like DNA-binding protein